ncbi:chorismate synthase, partial [Listeria monocytogenes]|uniref:chorismate synthase n=1 Tax=Listeria monocytogenes TaxID=1639 RepID=UPI002096801B
MEGVPAGMPLLAEDVNKELKRRQGGHGRGARMRIEKDQVQITAGILHVKTLSAPVAMFVENKDWKQWETVMSIETFPEKKEK